MQKLASALLEKNEHNDVFFDKSFFIKYNKLSSDCNYETFLKDLSLIKSDYILAKKTEILKLKKNDTLLIVNSDNTVFYAYKLFKNLTKIYENIFLLDTFKNKKFIFDLKIDPEQVLEYENDASLLYFYCIQLNPSLIIFNSINWNLKLVSTYLNKYNYIFVGFSFKKFFDKNIIPKFVISEEIKKSYEPMELFVLDENEIENISLDKNSYFINFLNNFNLVKIDLNLPEDFNVKDYRNFNSDLKKYSDQYLRDHYLTHGIREKRIYKLELPDGFDTDIYKNLNPDLKNLSNLDLQKHYINYGKRENRPYKDDFFDKDFFISENNISNYIGYENYLNNITLIKSLKIKQIIQNLPEIDKEIVLVNHKSSFNGAAQSLYSMANFLKSKNKSFIILDTDINKNLISKFNLEIEDVISYYNDPSILYWVIYNIKNQKIIFNSVNLSMIKVYPFIKNKVVLFSRETQKTYIDHFKETPNFVITEFISNCYREPKPLVQHPILLPFLLKKIEENILEDVFIENLNLEKITIGMAGSIGPRKNFDLFVKIAENLPQFNFVWIGGEKENVNLTNFFQITYEAYPYKYYKILDYFILTSEEEPFGNVILENLFIGNKILTFKNNIYYNHNCEELRNIYFEYDGYINIDNAIKHILNVCLEKKINISDNGKKYVINNFSQYNNQLLSLLNI